MDLYSCKFRTHGVELSGLTISNCTMDSQEAALTLTSCSNDTGEEGFTVRMANVHFVTNQNIGGPSSLLVESDCVLHLNSVTFSQNEGRNGGTIQIQGGEVLAQNCLFTNNTANGFGGGIHVGNGTFEAVDCFFEGNMAKRFGGAIATQVGVCAWKMLLWVWFGKCCCVYSLQV